MWIYYYFLLLFYFKDKVEKHIIIVRDKNASPRTEMEACQLHNGTNELRHEKKKTFCIFENKGAAQFVSDLFGNHIVGFLMTRLKCNNCMCPVFAVWV